MEDPTTPSLKMLAERVQQLELELQRHQHPTERGGRLRFLGRLLVACTLSFAAVGTVVVQAQDLACSNLQTLGLLCFGSGQPASADGVNRNFHRLGASLLAKTGNLDSPDVSTGGYLTVAQGADFQCSGCGSTSALRGSSDWGRLTIQGRVISGSNNIHLSPPGGSNVIINNGYRAAGGSGGGQPGLDVAGDLTVRANTWGSGPTGGSYSSASNVTTERPRNQGWERQDDCNTEHRWRCPQGTYVCGVDTWHGCGWSWWDQNMRVVCCGL